MNALQKRLDAPSQMLNDGAPMEQVSGGRDSSEWSCHEEERSKWLRIVDVKLEEGQVAPSFMPWSWVQNWLSLLYCQAGETMNLDLSLADGLGLVGRDVTLSSLFLLLTKFGRWL